MASIGPNPATEASMFTNVGNTRIKDSSFHITQNTTNISGGDEKRLKGLYRRAARNAISNIGGRAEDAKCHPGTRVEVIDLIEQWMDDAQGLSRMFWLSGPAGAGKTAIMKTVMERCKERGMHTTNFFFFRGDPTRNLALPFVATLVYQILQLYPAAHGAVAGILATNPLILQASVGEQVEELIYPLFDVISKPSAANTRIYLLIDGLDECDVDANVDQARIIQALSNLATRQDSPFLVLIASRPEARIRMAFNQLSAKVQSIFLDDQYSPQDDIRLFVNAEFSRIKASHPSAASLPQNWPSESDVEDIVAKSSGQFIYAATVMRFIGQASTVPSLSLQWVKGVIPPANNSPFAHLDSIYTFIFSQAHHPEEMRALLSMKILADHSLAYDPAGKLLQQYDSRYIDAVIESCVMELSAIVNLEQDLSLHFYHASMTDFLLDQSRSGTYWIDINTFRENVLVSLWGRTDHRLESVVHNLLHELDKPTARITYMLLKLPFPDWTRSEFVTKESDSDLYFLNTIYKLYYADDVKTYKRIVRRFIQFSISSNKRPDVTGAPYAAECLLRYDRYSWWFKLLKIIRIKK